MSQRNGFLRRAGHIGLATALLFGCSRPEDPVIGTLPGTPVLVGRAAPRVNGDVGAPKAAPPAQYAYGQTPSITPPNEAPAETAPGDITLDFADTDIRDVVAQILGAMLRVNYIIDPAVHGTATLHTARPLARSELIPTLQALLRQDNAALVQTNGLFRVVPAAVAAATTSLAADESEDGSVVVPLRFAAAEDLAKVLQPFVGNGGKVVADPGHNALLVTADASSRDTLLSLVRAFDVNQLAGQSYALLPVESGSVKDFASAMQDALHGQGGGSLVRVVPMERVNAVLVISSQPRYIDEARRVFGIVERARQQNVRSWHVYYLQNSHANDMAYVLQQAFTPNNVTAQPGSATQPAPSLGAPSSGAGGVGGLGGGAMGGGIGGAGGIGAGGIGGSSSIGGGGLGGAGLAGSLGSAGGVGIPGTANGLPPGAPRPAAGAAGGGNPLLGGLEQGSTDENADAMRIIPNEQNNALLIYTTAREESTVEAMMRKIDILPLQVRIDAVIAEVTLNDNLQYGTQFFFKAGGVNSILSFNANTLSTATSSYSLANNFPGFLIGGTNNGGAPLAISALQAVTTVHVLSSPELLVLDNQPARLQVGAVVPYLSQTAQSTLTTGAPVVNSVNYQQTGVIMQVTPRVNSGGLVTLDVQQEVSDVAATVTTSGLNSPTFNERSVTSRVVVQDGQTIGLAGLIQDSTTRGNQGIPWLKDIPLLGALASNQNNTRQRTELLVLITPHVVHDQRDARALTEDLRDTLANAAAVPDELQTLRPTGSADPGAKMRGQLGLQ